MSVVDQVNNSPVCPKCDNKMVLRTSTWGPFWGCMTYPKCRGIRKVEDVEFEKAALKSSKKPGKVHFRDTGNEEHRIVRVNGTDEQEAIWHGMTRGKSHIVINAGPGTGKSFTLVQGCLRIPSTTSVRIMAFNRHIDKEMQTKIAASNLRNVKSCTFHSYGFNTLRLAFPKLTDINEHKMKEILENLSPMPAMGKSEWRKGLNLAEKLCSFVKNYYLNYKSPYLRDELETLADHHGLDFYVAGKMQAKVPTTAYAREGLPANFDDAASLVRPAIEECMRQTSYSVDYDDLLWLPLVLDLPFPQSDMTFTDESQDLNATQHEITLRSCMSGRIVVVGDTHQAIYGFRGASTSSMEELTAALKVTNRGVREFPLTITRRCPKIHVTMAQQLFPDINALEDAPMGEIIICKPDEAVDRMELGDLVLCRTNAPVIKAAYALIKRKLRPSIKGREIGKGLLQLLDTLEKKYNGADIPKLVEALAEYRSDQMAKLLPLGRKAEGRISVLTDKCDCMYEFFQNSLTPEELKQNIHQMFSDTESTGNVVTLGTVHRTKGLESSRVFILCPEQIPHPMAKQPWELLQEKNLAWIAATRAKFDNAKGAPGTIIFAGAVPAIYGGTSGPDSKPENPAAEPGSRPK